MWATETRVRSVGIAPAAVVAATIALLVARFDAIPVLLAGAAIAIVIALVMWPAAAIGLAAGLVVGNVSAAFRETFPPAAMFAGAFAPVLAIPFIRRFIVDGRVAFDRTLGWMLALLGVMLLSSFRAVDQPVAIARILQFAAEGLVLYWLLLQVVRTRELLRVALWGIAVTMAALAALSVYQEVSGNYRQQFGGLAQRQLRHELAAAAAGKARPDPGKAAVRVSERAAGPVGDPNRHAQNLLMALPLAVYLAGRRVRWPRRLSAAAVAALIGIGIPLTYSRGAFIALALLVGAAVGWRFLHRGRVALALAAGAAVFAVTMPAYSARIGTILNSVALLDDTRGADDADAAIRGRATEMLAAFHAFADHPLLGVGPGQYTPFYSVAYQQRDDVKFRTLSIPREPHNLFLAIAAELGLAGLVVFVALVTGLAVNLSRARRRWLHVDLDMSRLATALLLALMAYVACGLFLHLAYERYFWFLLGTAGAALNILRREEARLGAPAPA